MKTAEDFIRDKFKLGKNDFKPNTSEEKVLTNGQILEALKEFTKQHIQACKEAIRDAIYAGKLEENSSSIDDFYSEHVK